ncbi:hypothetical protein LTR86_003064 [Recurvomyces mirabilis]|nr:hypothetical protein LTR86_003064 [Recurvomyces mirabilis]
MAQIMPPPPPTGNKRERAVAVRGILYLLQHHTDELKTRNGQTDALVKLVSQHTFPRQNFADNYDAPKLRAVGADLATELSIGGNQFEDRFDMLCHKGVAAVPNHVLAHYEYDPVTFTEAELPPFNRLPTSSTATGKQPVSARESGGNKYSYVQRATWIVLQDIDKVKHYSADADYKYRSSEHIVGSLRHLIVQYSLHEYPTVDGRTHNFDPVRLMRAVAQVTRRVKSTRTTEGRARSKKYPVKLNIVWKRGTGGVDDPHLRRLESAAQHRESIDGTPSYDDASTTTMSHYADVVRAMKKHGLDVSFVNTDRMQRCDRTKAATIQGTKASKQREDDVGDGIGLYTGSVSPSTTVFDDGSDDEEVVVLGGTAPRKRSLQQSKHSEPGTTTGARQTSFDVDVDMLQHFDEPRPRAPLRTTRAGRRTRSSSAYNGHDALALHSGTPRSSHRVIHIDLGTIKKDMEQLSTLTTRLVENLFVTLGLENSLPSPVDWNADERLLELYKRCLGAAWQQTVASIKRDRLAFATDILSCLVSAWIHDQIFSDDAPWQSFLKSALAFAKRLGSAMETELAILFENYVVPHATHQADAFDLVHKLQEESMADMLRSAAFERKVGAHTREITRQLTSILDPHMRRLYDVARTMNEGVREHGWQTQLQSGIEGIVTQAIKLKAKLCYATFSNYHHRFIWPEHKSPLDAISMRARWDEPDGEVVPACLPGLEAHFPDGTVDCVYRAQVIARSSS